MNDGRDNYHKKQVVGNPFLGTLYPSAHCGAMSILVAVAVAFNLISGSRYTPVTEARLLVRRLSPENCRMRL